MPTLKKETLDKTIQTIDGRGAVEMDGSLITFRKALVSCCGIYQPQVSFGPAALSPAQIGEEAIRAYDLGVAFHKERDVELSKQDTELLKKIVQTNRVYVAFITAQLYKLLESLDSKEVKVEKKK